MAGAGEGARHPAAVMLLRDPGADIIGLARRQGRALCMPPVTPRNS
jgi:hypothetical protein